MPEDPVVTETLDWIERNIIQIPGADGNPPSPAEIARRYDRIMQITDEELLTRQAECYLRTQAGDDPLPGCNNPGHA
jgi:hypothetical protein